MVWREARYSSFGSVHRNDNAPSSEFVDVVISRGLGMIKYVMCGPLRPKANKSGK